MSTAREPLARAHLDPNPARPSAHHGQRGQPGGRCWGRAPVARWRRAQLRAAAFSTIRWRTAPRSSSSNAGHLWTARPWPRPGPRPRPRPGPPPRQVSARLGARAEAEAEAGVGAHSLVHSEVRHPAALSPGRLAGARWTWDVALRFQTPCFR